MKLIDHTELMTMPNGTVYQEFGKTGLGPPMVFGGQLDFGSDYTTANLLPEDNFGSAIGADEDGYFIFYPSGFGRDGFFDPTRHYIVWEEDDRKKIAKWLLDPAKAFDQMNDDPHAIIAVDVNIRAV